MPKSEDKVYKIYIYLVHNFNCEWGYNTVIDIQGLHNDERPIRDVDFTFIGTSIPVSDTDMESSGHKLFEKPNSHVSLKPTIESIEDGNNWTQWPPKIHKG